MLGKVDYEKKRIRNRELEREVKRRQAQKNSRSLIRLKEIKRQDISPCQPMDSEDWEYLHVIVAVARVGLWRIFLRISQIIYDEY